MWHIASRGLASASLVFSLGACGLAQTVADGTSATAQALWHKQVRVLHLDFIGRPQSNTDAFEDSELAVPTLVRVYQLRDGKALQRGAFEALVSDAAQTLGDDLLSERALVIRPGAGAQLDMPLDPQAKQVAVVALFRQPEPQGHSWRVTLSRDDLDPDRARVLVLGENRLTLQPWPQD